MDLKLQSMYQQVRSRVQHTEVGTKRKETRRREVTEEGMVMCRESERGVQQCRVRGMAWEGPPLCLEGYLIEVRLSTEI